MSNLIVLYKAVLEGLAVAVVAFLTLKRDTSLWGVFLIGLTAAAIFSVLDVLAPEIGMSARQGAGFGVGLNTVGWGQIGGFEDCKFTCANNPNRCKMQGPCQKIGGGSTSSCLDSHAPVTYKGLGTDWSHGQATSGSRSFHVPDSTPVNKNTNEYKLVPGSYSKYVLKSGYNDNVGTYNEIEYRE